MPDQSGQPLYAIEPLLSLVEQGYTLLTPNLRLARHISSAIDQHYATSGARAWHAPRVHAVEAWLQLKWQQAVRQGRVPARQRLTAVQISVLWRQAIERSAGAGTSLSLLQPESAVQLARDARDNLLHWLIDLSARSVRQQFSLHADAAEFLRWCAAFEQQLAGSDFATPADCLHALLAAEAPAAGELVVLVEAPELSPLQDACLAAICTDRQRYAAPARQAQVQSLRFDDERSELQTIARWCAQTATANPQGRIGVVLSDMRQRAALDHFLRREFDCFDAAYTQLPVNYSAGIALDRAPVIELALDLLALSQETVSLKKLLRVLNAPHLPLHDRDSAAMATLVDRLLRLTADQLDAGALRYLASQPAATEEEPASAEATELGDKLRVIYRLLTPPRRRSPSEWVHLFVDILAIWGWPQGIALDSLEYQQLQLWQQVLEDCCAFDALLPALAQGAALSLLASCCRERVFQPKTQDASVQVLGPLEATGLAFDELWVAGVDAGSWPAPARPNPLLPPSLQRVNDMPHCSAAREWNYAQGLIRRYRCAVQRLTLSYAAERDGVPVLASSFIEQPSVAPTAPVPLDEARWWAGAGEHALQWVQDEQSPRVQDEELTSLRGGAALLANQSVCPFRAFASHRLKVQPLSMSSASLTASERGEMLHAALAELWGGLHTSMAMRAATAEQRQHLLDRAAGVGADALGTLRNAVLGPGRLALERRRLATLLDEWWQLEAARQQDFQVSEREAEQRINVDRLSLTLRVDRVDTLADGRRVIIDYKSGKGSRADWFGERPAQLQLPLYAVHTGRQAAAVAFANVRARECEFVGVGETEFAAGVTADVAKAAGSRDRVASWDELCAAWQQRLLHLAQSFLSGAAAVDPLRDDSCTFCGLQALCRIDTDVQP